MYLSNLYKFLLEDNMNKKYAIGYLCFYLVMPLMAEEDNVLNKANYQLAGRFAPYKIKKLLYSTSINAKWIEGTENFWYEWKTADGKSFYMGDPIKGTKQLLFDNDKIAAELTRITRDPWDAKHLPIEKIKFIDENTLQFDVKSSQDDKGDEVIDEEIDEQKWDIDKKEKEKEKIYKKKVFHFEYKINTQNLRELKDWEAPDKHPKWANVSPDGETIVFARNHNLYMINASDYKKILDAGRGKDGKKAEDAIEKVTVNEIQLTRDGEENYSYAIFDRGDTDDKRKRDKGKRKRTRIYWAKDSKKFASIRSDQRKSKELWVVHSVKNKRPKLETYKYDMAGDKNVTQYEIDIHDLATQSILKLDIKKFKDQRIGVYSGRKFRYPDSDKPQQTVWLAEDSKKLYFYRQSRDMHKMDVCVADAETGEVKVLFEEKLNTYIELQRLELLKSGDMIWWSERDGWAHLYYYEKNGTLKRQITSGPFSVRRIVGVDERKKTIYFIANGREKNEDPYFQHLYSVFFDGTKLKLLNKSNFDHRVSMGESNRFFVNNYSRVNTLPQSALYNTSGKKMLDLEEGDLSQLMAAGFQYPEPFKVKSADGVTDIYGVMTKPFDFDPNNKYPIIAYVYPGPQTESVAKSFTQLRHSTTALAQFGFIVITIGNRGGHPARSKWYHNYGYGNLRDYGLADKKAGIEQLADRYDFIDIDRVGIYGHSGGGFMSTAAMLVYPDFFKVAVSSSGNHNNDVYNSWWSEKHHGIKEVVDDSGRISFEYDIAKNSDLAKNLQGHLLLTTGDIDNNVHMAGTLRMAEALIRANKRFDFFLFPGQRHGYGNMGDYWHWLRAEYFVKHLIGDTYWDPNIAQLNVEKEKKE